MLPKTNLLLLISLLSILPSLLAWEWPLESPDPIDYCYPDQVHISLGDAYYNSLNNFASVDSSSNSNSSVIIVWQTQAKCDIFYVMVTSTEMAGFSLNVTSEDIWIENLDEIVEKDWNKIDADGQYITYSHSAFVAGLTPGISYTYEIFQTNGTNSQGPFTFYLPPISPKSEETIKFAVYGDVDTGDNVTYNALKRLQDNDPKALTFQMFLGDLGYDIFSENGKRGEYCYNGWQDLHSSWPFMVTPGNHEWYKNYTFLNIRTRMPLYNKTNNHYYSFNVGKIHIVALNYYLYQDEGDDIKQQMVEWIEEDLKTANATRDERPWIIVTSHQPIYCSLNDPDDKERKRCYHFYERNVVFDELYYKYRVDLVLQGHAHIWERMAPLAQNKTKTYYTFEETQDKVRNYIIKAQAPIYTLESATGNKYYMGKVGELENYTMNTDSTLSYSTVTLVNSSSLKYEHWNSKTGELMDYFYLMKGAEFDGMPLVPVEWNSETKDDENEEEEEEENNDDNKEPEIPENPDREPGMVRIDADGRTGTMYWILFGGLVALGIIGGLFIYKRSKKDYAKFPREFGANVVGKLEGKNSSGIDNIAIDLGDGQEGI
jgi:predicted MPP superfamily phosphohydrolase